MHRVVNLQIWWCLKYMNFVATIVQGLLFFRFSYQNFMWSALNVNNRFGVLLICKLDNDISWNPWEKYDGDSPTCIHLAASQLNYTFFLLKSNLIQHKYVSQAWSKSQFLLLGSIEPLIFLWTISFGRFWMCIHFYLMSKLKRFGVKYVLKLSLVWVVLSSEGGDNSVSVTTKYAKSGEFFLCEDDVRH